MYIQPLYSPVFFIDICCNLEPKTLVIPSYNSMCHVFLFSFLFFLGGWRIFHLTQHSKLFYSLCCDQESLFELLQPTLLSTGRAVGELGGLIKLTILSELIYIFFILGFLALYYWFPYCSHSYN